MEKETLDAYKKAGRICATAREFGAKMIKENAKAVDIAAAVEKKIIALGARPAFQATVSINDVAAHYAPLLNDPLKIRAGDYVKLDIGVHVDGWIADTAITVRPAGKDSMIECAEKMLAAAIPMFVPGTIIEDISAVMEDVAIKYGFKPVANLTGHALDRWTVHGGVVIPCIRGPAPKVLSEGEAYGVEPFVTAGKGMVKDSPPPTIFRWISDRPPRLPLARQLLAAAKNDWQKLPFARRWAQEKFGNVDLALNQLVKLGSLYPYNILKEVSGKPVAQAEHTVIVADKPIVITL
ncbi:MAG: type II methionyl aminopeptidase [Candidatus Aenigmatarchaeota archaeon]